MNRTLRIGGACLNQTPINWKNNQTNILNAIKQAQENQLDVLCLPELCITGYGCEDLFLSEWLPEKAMNMLLEIVPHTQNIAVAIGLPVRIASKIYNTTCWVVNGEIQGFYAKQKLANEGVHYETRWFEPWKPLAISKIKVGGTNYPIGHISPNYKNVKIAFEICEDAWREDRPGLLVKEAELFLNPSASHFAFKKADFREKLVCNSSKLLDCVYLYTNLLGNEAGKMIYDGDIIVAQKGKLIGQNRRLSMEDFNLLYLDIDFDKTQKKTNIEPKFSCQNEEFTHAATLALFDYMRKSRSKGFVLSLSGGADSSTVGALVHQLIVRGLEELGFDEFERKVGFKLQGKSSQKITHQLLTTAYQATKNSSSSTFNAAKSLADGIGATFYHWHIDDEVNNYRQIIEKNIGRPLTWEQDDITLQNIQARMRSPIIWMLANINYSLLLATSNRSEGDVGYATMDGDTSGSISPIAGVSKYFVLQWLKYAEKELGINALHHVNSLQPTAELRPSNQNQTDEEDLMPYEVLVKIERIAIFERKSPKEVFEELKSEFDHNILKSWIKKFFKLWSRNQWKRERYAPAFHFDDFNIDPRSWCRFPILSGGYMEELNELN